MLGVLHVGTLTPRDFTADDRDLLQLAADRAAVAIQHAELYERERSRARSTLQAVQRVADAALAYLPADELLPELLERISALFGTDTAAILLLDPAGERLRARGEGDRGGGRAGGGDPAGPRVRGPDRGGAAGDHDRRCRSRRHPQSDPAGEGDPVVAGGAAAGGGRVWGCCTSGRSRRAVHRRRPELLQLAADRAAVAIQARALQQRGVADALQRQPAPGAGWRRGLALAARYRPAARRAASAATGTTRSRSRRWRLAVVAGDVVGHGIAAAAVMAQMRTAAAYAIDGPRRPPSRSSGSTGSR